MDNKERSDVETNDLESPEEPNEQQQNDTGSNNIDKNPNVFELIMSKITETFKGLVSSSPPRSGAAGVSRLYAGASVMFLGQPYPSTSDIKFLDDFESRPWITYRHSFPPIQPSSYTSDVGWGCMLRSGQMMLANAFIYHYLGRSWRRSQLRLDRNSWNSYVKILSWFADSNTSPYSIHRVALMGRQFDKEIGEWFGPSTISQVLKVLVQHHKETDLNIHVASDGVIYRTDLTSIWAKDGDPTQSPSPVSVLILIPLRLGLDQLNPVYFPALQSCFEIPQCVGIAGGKPNHSLFFVGVESDKLVFLDPHHLRPTVEVKDMASYTPEDLDSYHCPSARLAPIASVDPSLVIGFYCKNEEEFDELCARCQTISQGKTPLFTIAESPPNYEESVDVVSDDEF
ncbi:hypothetical protein SmJEL517_g05490 [Synchytrium microbalum]|uniref:Cysteine protease n=1 Tax=Synchytrium microbalum TaxID=1806994 RepID=A0A507BV65_9FUNG|nr:uncharacterized protein SmJEL517_g05490 [Synchytrium microbalum]TPX31071.1 hypothetical protein SmJEL517_g05490 [Synchytrium microbalum]